MAQLNSRSLFERSPSRLAATLTKNSIVSRIMAGNGRDESKKTNEKNDVMTVHKLCRLGREVAPKTISYIELTLIKKTTRSLGVEGSKIADFVTT